MPYIKSTINITPSAKISNIKGSVARRMELSETLSETFYAEIKSLQKEQKKVYLKDVKKILQKICPELNIKIKKNYKCGVDGYIKPSYKENILDGFTLSIKAKGLFNKLLPPDGFTTLFHEVKHLFDYSTQPKLSKRVGNRILNEEAKLIKLSPIKSLWLDSSDFYSSFLYCDERIHNRINTQNKMSKLNMALLPNYSSVIYQNRAR